MALVIRSVTPDDAPRLATLFGEIDTTHFRPHDMTRDGAQLIAARSGTDIYLLGLDGSTPVVYGMLRGWDEGFAVPSIGVAVRRDSLRQGHGRAMMRALHRAARERAAARIRLRVHPDNEPARRLYESLGYVDAGEERGERLMFLELTWPE